MTEILMMYMMSVSSAFFAIGGYRYKAIRRFGIPLALGVPLWFLVPHWQCIAYTLSLCTALHLGYGERTAYPMKLLTFAAYFLPCLFIGFSYWIIIAPFLCLGIFFLSNFKPTSDMFFWKFAEAQYGLLIAVCLINTIQRG